MAAEESIYSALGSLVSNRCYPVSMAQGATLPAIVYARVSTDTIQTLDKSTTIENGQFLVNCYASTISAARTLAASVRSAMAASALTNELQDESLEYDPDTDLDYVSLRYSCWEVS